MQRRRRKKAAPKNIFGASSQSTSKAKSGSISKPKSPKARSPRAAPPSAPGSRPKPVTKPKPLPIKDIVEDAEISTVELKEPSSKTQSVDDDETILESQILGDQNVEEITPEQESKKPEKKTEKKPEETSPKTQPIVEDSGKSLKARQIIENSLLRASIAAEKEKTSAVSTKTSSETKTETKKSQKKFRSKTSSYQPANRARRLDRSRHMEYKYEMRGLLVEIGVSEEFRSNLLATVWARGERQTTKEAKDFLQEKLYEGIIDDDQMKSLESVVDNYTIRR